MSTDKIAIFYFDLKVNLPRLRFKVVYQASSLTDAIKQILTVIKKTNDRTVVEILRASIKNIQNPNWTLNHSEQYKMKIKNKAEVQTI